MTKGFIYKHINNTDVAFLVKHIFRIDTKTVEVKGEWINIVNPKNPYTIDHDKIRIQIEDLKNWKWYEQQTFTLCS